MATQWDVTITCEKKVAAEIFALLNKECEDGMTYMQVMDPAIRVSKCGTVTEFSWSQVVVDATGFWKDLGFIFRAFDMLGSEGTGYIALMHNDYNEAKLKRSPYRDDSPLSHAWLTVESDDFSEFVPYKEVVKA